MKHMVWALALAGGLSGMAADVVVRPSDDGQRRYRVGRIRFD